MFKRGDYLHQGKVARSRASQDSLGDALDQCKNGCYFRYICWLYEARGISCPSPRETVFYHRYHVARQNPQHGFFSNSFICRLVKEYISARHGHAKCQNEVG